MFRLRGAFVPVLVALALMPSCHAKKRVPVAIEAGFKRRITTKLQGALDKATAQLAWALGVDGGKLTAPMAPEVFAPGYELDFNLEDGAGSWRSSCERDIDPERDSPSYCATHKLQALAALCEVKGAAELYREGISGMIEQLLDDPDTLIPGLGVKRHRIRQGVEVWTVETAFKSGKYDVSPALHAAIMRAVVQCSSSLKESDMMSQMQSWFDSLRLVYRQDGWEKNSFHINAIMLEAFIMILDNIRADSHFAASIRPYVRDLETFMQAQFEKTPKAWSFSGAHATVISWLSEKKAARRKQLGQTIDEYMRRWIELAPNMRVNESYTCGPLQGVAPLMLRRGSQASNLVGSILSLAEKDVNMFQFWTGKDENDTSIHSYAAERLGNKWRNTHKAAIEGVFLRDDHQLANEKRKSIRMDDTSQCVMGLSRTMRLLDDLQGIELPEGYSLEAEGDAAQAEKLEGAAAEDQDGQQQDGPKEETPAEEGSADRTDL